MGNSPHWTNGIASLYLGDVRDVPAGLPEHSVHTCVTSPPYWGLRDYGIDRQLGLEPTPETYIENMVQVFRAVWRVLRDDGTLWLNLGDSYASNWPSPNRRNVIDNAVSAGKRADRRPHIGNGLKEKDLVGIPWRVALALQADGWYLRSDIIWSKPNPMPESVTDRPTKAHEYLFLLSKQPRYYYDAEAIREPVTESTLLRLNQDIESQIGSTRFIGKTNGNMKTVGTPDGRNKRTVWDIPTQGYSEAHFATFPEKLVEPCILAGTSEHGVCPECGAPWERVVKIREEYKEWATTQRYYGEGGKGSAFREAKSNSTLVPQKADTTGWQPTCVHDLEPMSATVLDPFVGSGTTSVVANRLGRRSIGIDISEEYLALATKRIQGQPLSMFVVQ